MKAYFPKFIITQGAIILFVLSLFVIPIFIGMYLNQHIVHPCSSENVLAQTCSYDTPLASWLNGTRNWYDAGTPAFDLQNELYGTLNRPLRNSPGWYGKYLPAISVVLALIIILNGIWFIIERVLHLKKKLTSETSVR